MSQNKYSLVLTGILAHLQFGVFAFLIDRYFVLTAEFPSYIHIGGTCGLVLFGIAYLFYFIGWFGQVKSWEFHFFIYPLFLTSSLDVWATTDFLRANPLIFPSYIKTGDEILESLFAEVDAYLDGTLLFIINLIILYRFQNGLSWRSLVLFITTIFLVMLVVFSFVLGSMSGQACLLTQGFYVFFPYIAVSFILLLAKQREFSFRIGKSRWNPWNVIVWMMMLGTIGIYLGKVVVALGYKTTYFDIFETTDPMILFSDVDDALPAGLIHVCCCALTVVPTMTVGILYVLTDLKKPAFLWDMAVIQLGVIFMSQTYAIIGPYHWDVPTNVKPPKGINGISNADYVFWLMNLTPIVAGLLYLLSLSKDKQYETGKHQLIKGKKSK